VVTGGTTTANGILSAPHGLTTLDTMPHSARALIAYAGPFSQVRGRTGRRPTMRQMFAVMDAGGCRDYSELCASGGTVAGVDVVPLVERCWPAVTTVALKLFKDGAVKNADVLAALGLSADDEVRGIELAMIRSGSAPGSFTVSPRGG
jgi:hypothetical protein